MLRPRGVYPLTQKAGYRRVDVIPENDRVSVFLLCLLNT